MTKADHAEFEQLRFCMRWNIGFVERDLHFVRVLNREFSAPHRRVVQVGFRQHDSVRHAARPDRPAKPCFAQIRPAQIALVERRTRQLGTRQVRTSQIHSIQYTIEQFCILQIGICEIQFVESGASQRLAGGDLGSHLFDIRLDFRLNRFRTLAVQVRPIGHGRRFGQQRLRTG